MNCTIIRSRWSWLTLVLPLVLTSCRVTSHSVANSQNNKDIERLEIIYQAHPANGPLFSTSSSGVVQASATIPADHTPFENMTWSKAELRIECPHPDGRTDVARVTLRFRPVDCGKECERKSWSEKREERADMWQLRRATFRERWFYESPDSQEIVTEMELPKSELDLILAELNSHGFFVEPKSAAVSESHLEVRLNRRWTSRQWGYEPSLDALTTRVYHEGVSRPGHVKATDDGRFKPFGWLIPFGRSQ